MSIFGSSYPVISGSLGVVGIEHCKLDYRFFNPDVIEHVSVLTGHKSYPYSRNKSEFQLDVLLCNYTGSNESSSLAKFNDLYRYKDTYFNFYPHANWSASVNVTNEPIEFYFTNFTSYYLSNDERYDGILITITSRQNTVLHSKQVYGYGHFNYGTTNYGLG